MRNASWKMALSVATVAWCAGAHAAPGTLDPTFDVTVNGGTTDEQVLDVVVGASGKVYVLDQTGETTYKLLRFKTDGTLDGAFGTGGGIAFTGANNVITGVESYLALAIDEAGSAAYVGGGSGTLAGGARMLVRKLGFSGEFDSAYGMNGRARVDTPGDGAVIRMTFQGKKLLLAGVDGALGTDDEGDLTIVGTSPYIARLTAAGGVDGTFAQTGIDWGTTEEAPTGITVEDTGTILVSGITGLVASLRAGTGSALARLNAAGGLDDGFGNAGLVKKNFAAGTCAGEPDDEVCETIGLYYPQPDGAFLVSVYLDRAGSDDEILVQRFTANGNLSGAALKVPAEDYLAGGTPAIDADGRVIVATEAPREPPNDVRVYRIEGYAVVGQPNRPPVAANDRRSVLRNSGANVVKPLRNDSDPDGDVLKIVKVTQPVHGTATVGATKKTVIYTPDTGYQGKDPFKYTISDGRGGRATATVTVTVAP